MGGKELIAMGAPPMHAAFMLCVHEPWAQRMVGRASTCGADKYIQHT